MIGDSDGSLVGAGVGAFDGSLDGLVGALVGCARHSTLYCKSPFLSKAGSLHSNLTISN